MLPILQTILYTAGLDPGEHSLVCQTNWPKWEILYIHC